MIINIVQLTAILFTIGDLWFGYNDFSCTNSWITHHKIGMGLGTWLKVSGYTSLLYLIIPTVGMFLGRLGAGLMKIYNIFAAVYSLFRFIWLILGSIIFWGYLSGTGACSSALNTYMWINLIWSWLLLLLSCYSQQQAWTVGPTYSTTGYAV